MTNTDPTTRPVDEPLVLVIAGTHQSRDATHLARTLEAAGRHVEIARDHRGHTAHPVGALIALTPPLDAAISAAALDTPVLHLTATTRDDCDLAATLAEPIVTEHPLISYRLDGRPARLAAAECVLTHTSTTHRLQAHHPGRTTVDATWVRVSNADPLGLLPPDAAATGAGVIIEWAGGLDTADGRGPLGRRSELIVSTTADEPISVHADAQRVTAIATRVRITNGPTIRFLRPQPHHINA